MYIHNIINNKKYNIFLSICENEISWAIPVFDKTDFVFCLNLIKI